MSDDRRDPAAFWLQAIPEGTQHLVIHIRNADDVQSLIEENNQLRDQLKKQQRDILAWLNVGSKYHDCLDELKEIRKYFKDHGISYRFRNI